MKTKTQHTPTPWIARKFDDTKSTTLYADSGIASLGSIKKEEDAAFIVCAVNNHETLRGELKSLVAWIAEHHPEEYARQLRNAQAAIAQAEGGK